jgi:uncharacterized membrane protein
MTAPPPDLPVVSERRQTFDSVALPWIESFVRFVGARWLALTNLALAVFVGLPVLSPILEASDSPVLNLAGQAIFIAYRATCHQLPQRSFFVEGHQVAWCERDVAIWGSMLAAGLLFGVVRKWLRPLDFRLYLLFCVPMALDGFTQLFGWRESTWELRTITGTIFGLASAWLVLPILERGMNDVRRSLERPRDPA